VKLSIISELVPLSAVLSVSALLLVARSALVLVVVTAAPWVAEVTAVPATPAAAMASTSGWASAQA